MELKKFLFLFFGHRRFHHICSVATQPCIHRSRQPAPRGCGVNYSFWQIQTGFIPDPWRLLLKSSSIGSWMNLVVSTHCGPSLVQVTRSPLGCLLSAWRSSVSKHSINLAAYRRLKILPNDLSKNVLCYIPAQIRFH